MILFLASYSSLRVYDILHQELTNHEVIQKNSPWSVSSSSERTCQRATTPYTFVIPCFSRYPHQTFHPLHISLCHLFDFICVSRNLLCCDVSASTHHSSHPPPPPPPLFHQSLKRHCSRLMSGSLLLHPQGQTHDASCMIHMDRPSLSCQSPALRCAALCCAVLCRAAERCADSSTGGNFSKFTSGPY